MTFQCDLLSMFYSTGNHMLILHIIQGLSLTHAIKTAPEINTEINDAAVTCNNRLAHICEVTQQLEYCSMLNFIHYY